MPKKAANLTLDFTRKASRAAVGGQRVQSRGVDAGTEQVLTGIQRMAHWIAPLTGSQRGPGRVTDPGSPRSSPFDLAV